MKESCATVKIYLQGHLLESNMVIKENILLKDYTSYKTGGNALFFADCISDGDVYNALKFACDNNLKYEVIGGGSNLLVSDKGFNGLIICTKNLNRYIINTGKNILKCGSGIVLADLVLYACNHGLAGMEALAGIPGSTGGACKMNAGAYNQEIKDTLLNVTFMNKDGSISTLENEKVGFWYRKSQALKDKIVLKAEFLYNSKSSEELLNIRKETLDKRKEKQPLHKPSCGSVFKRPEGNYAGTLIEKCGLKGYSIGGAIVSPKHANFILNENNATSSDIYNLINHVIKEVHKQTGITLEPEVRLIGFDD